MASDLVEKCARVAAEADDEFSSYAEIARAVLSLALEEAAKAIECDCCDVCGESPDYGYVCANELASRVRSLIPAEERE